MDKITKLSQTIRLGASFRPKAIGELFCHQQQTSCALGAAAEGAGIVNWDDGGIEGVRVSMTLELRFPELKVQDEHYPEESGSVYGTLSDTIVHLSDNLDWSREDIADWLQAKGL